METEYGFGQIVVGGPTYREKTEAEKAAERRADRLPLPELLTLIGNFDEAKVFGLPEPIGRTIGVWNPTPYWSRKQVSVWRDRLRAVAAKLK